jgi:hypothetical protein
MHMYDFALLWSFRVSFVFGGNASVCGKLLAVRRQAELLAAMPIAI